MSSATQHLRSWRTFPCRTGQPGVQDLSVRGVIMHNTAHLQRQARGEEASLSGPITRANPFLLPIPIFEVEVILGKRAAPVHGQRPIVSPGRATLPVFCFTGRQGARRWRPSVRHEGTERTPTCLANGVRGSGLTGAGAGLYCAWRTCALGSAWRLAPRRD